MKYTLTFLVLLIISLIPSYGQTGDTLTGYTHEELQKIAAMVVRARECNELLDIAEQDLVIKDSIIYTQDSTIIYRNTVISSQNTIISSHNEIIMLKDIELKEFKRILDKTNKKLKVVKVGWVGTTAGLLLFWLLSVI